MNNTPHYMARMGDPVLTLLAALQAPSPQPTPAFARLEEATRRLANYASVFAIGHDVPRAFAERVAAFDAAMSETFAEMVAQQVATAADRVLESGGGTGL